MNAAENGSFAYTIMPDGAATRIDTPPDSDAAPSCALLWRHIDGNDAACREWLETRSGIPEAAVWALLELETRPRAVKIGDGALVILRGRNSQQPLPFGPFLAAAGFVALLWGQPLVDAYRRFSGL